MAGPNLSTEHISLAKMAALKAGEILSTSFESKTEALTSNSRDIKTQADLDSHHTIKSILTETGIPVLSEESEYRDADPSKDPCWIVDPLDGTVNFFRGSRLCCTSIGYWSGGMPVFGVVYDFLAKELCSGGPNFPTTCNKRAVVVSGITQSNEAIIATGFPNGRNFNDGPLKTFLSQIQSFRKVRLLGSAALSMAWLAQGRLDAYSEEDIYLWDVAAGLPLVLGAGGDAEFSSIGPQSMKLNVTAASSSELLNTLKC